jgi:CheY-like chemotaxis protein
MSSPSFALVVDDEEAVRCFVREWLEDYGFECVDASDGREALVALDAHDFDLAVLDVRMPVMDGMELLREMRGRGLRTGVVMLTADQGYAIAAQGSTPVAADAYLRKPCTLRSLREAVDTACPR